MAGVERPLRVTHCPVNTAGIPWANVQALRARGVDARLVVFNRYRLHPEADIDLERRGGLIRQQRKQWQAFAQLAPKTDIFHFYFGLTLVPKSLQFPLLYALRKPSVMHFLGSDIRGRPARGPQVGAARRRDRHRLVRRRSLGARRARHPARHRRRRRSSRRRRPTTSTPSSSMRRRRVRVRARRRSSRPPRRSG